MSETTKPGPAVGQGGTIQYYTDRKACTVIAVSPSGHKVTVQEDTATRCDPNGMSESQIYTYAPNPAGEVHTFHRNKAGGYQARGRTLRLGDRDSYHDFSF